MGIDKEPSKIEFSKHDLSFMPTGEYTISLKQRVISVPFKLSIDLLKNSGDQDFGSIINSKLQKISGEFSTEEDFLKALQSGLAPEESLRVGDKIFKYLPDFLIASEIQKTFFVAGERFQISPGAVGGVFPPAYSQGEHSNVFPHIMINRSTFPWERQTVPNDTTTPWLALLIVDEREEGDATSSITKLSDTLNYLKIKEPLEPGQTGKDSIQILKVKKELLEKILPSKNDLRWLTHVRKTLDKEGKPTGREMAVVIANRLPQKGGNSKAYLVSLENRFDEGENGTFDYGTMDKEGMINLVQLYSWSFTCTSHFKISIHFLEKATDIPEAIREKMKKLVGKEYFKTTDFRNSLLTEAMLTQDEFDTYQEKLYKDFSYGDFAGILKHLDRTTATLRLPDARLPATSIGLPYLKMGYYPLPHKLRQGAQTVSWYHGPLSPLSASPPATASVPCSDSLMRYHQEIGMFDVSYAAAWELGRLLALQNTHFSVELYKWKNSYGRSQMKARQMQETPHLLGANRDRASKPVPPSVDNWLKDLALLKGVPFNYLVPDEELLPVESIRFFSLDGAWIQALTDGALSIGRASSHDLEKDKKMITAENLISSLAISGFILRSDTVSGWPGMQVEAFSEIPGKIDPPETSKLKTLRDEKLSDNVRLCFFEGILKSLSLHLKPETLHFGVHEEPMDVYSKQYRDISSSGDKAKTINIPVPISKEDRMLDLSSLLSNYEKEGKKQESSADLAVQLIEGVERVWFKA